MQLGLTHSTDLEDEVIGFKVAIDNQTTQTFESLFLVVLCFSSDCYSRNL